jgi:SAM-dependent methyltransferase
MTFLHRAASAWKRHGARNFIRLAAYNARLKLFSPGIEPKPDEFDAQYGTDTFKVKEVGALDIPAAAARDAVRYQPSSSTLVFESISALPIAQEDFSFIDYGSGKGRVLMIAAQFPFRRVVGFEISSELHGIATENLSRLPVHVRGAGRVLSVQCDAREATLPSDNLVCYFYNPFGERVMEAVATQLRQHVLKGHDLYVIYTNPRFRGVFTSGSDFLVLRDSEHILIARGRPQAQSLGDDTSSDTSLKNTPRPG